MTKDWDLSFRLTDSLRYTRWTVERANGERGDSFYLVYRLRDAASADD